MMPNELQGKIVLITGASSGIGQAAALAFARRGAKLALGNRRMKEGEETARMAREAGAEVVFRRTDVTVASEVEALAQLAVSTFGRLDCAFNNAGIDGDIAPTADCSEENWDKVMATNLKGVWLCMKHEIRAMLGHNGVIVNNASAAGQVGMRSMPAYAASKGGVIQLTRTAALEYAKVGIRVNAVCPGFIRTPMVEGPMAVNPKFEEFMLKVEPMGRLGTPEEVAEAVVWLSSDAAAFITGHAMAVDGGILAQ
ncbi:MAG: glucose 1-dehydrogenase [Terriglobia bacterium]